LSHQLNFVANRPLKVALGQKWAADASAGANIHTFESYFLQPTRLAKVAAAPAAFDDLSGAFLSRTYSSDGLAAAIATAPTSDSPLAPVFFGNRFLNMDVQAGLTYAHSSRLSVRFGGVGNRSQSLSAEVRSSSEAALITGVSEQHFAMPHSTSALAGVTVNYSLSPRTQLTGSLTSSKSFVGGGGYYTSSARIMFSRSMSRRWFAQLHGGSTLIHGMGGTPATLAPKPTWLAGAAMGFKTYAHTLLASGERTISNAYGLASAIELINAAWNWRLPDRNWWITVGASQERAQNQVPYDLRAWRTHVTAGRMLSREFAASLSYGWMRYRGVSEADTFNGKFSAVSVGLFWMPGGARVSERDP
jgi:hypothetical protein